MTIGERIRERRKALHLSQEDIARRAGISLNAMQRVESGQIESPRFITMVHLARSLGMRVEDFVEEEAAEGGPFSREPRLEEGPGHKLFDKFFSDLERSIRTGEGTVERAVIPPNELKTTLQRVWDHELRPNNAYRGLVAGGRIQKFIELKEGLVPSFPPEYWGESREAEETGVKKKYTKVPKRPKNRTETLEIGGVDDALQAVKEGRLDLRDANIALQKLEPYKGFRIVTQEGAEDREGQGQGV